MRRSAWLKIAYGLLIALVAAMLAFQLVIHLTGSDAESLHADTVDAIGTRVAGQNEFAFAVVGNVNNSMRVYRDQILPEIHNDPVQFLVSAGNFVSSGTEEGYQAALNILASTRMPFVLTYGPQEDSNFGSFRFYDRFGPHFYSFTAGNTHFVFLDVTGKTPHQWQLDWLDRELAVAAENIVVFTGLPLQRPDEESIWVSRDIDVDMEFRNALVERFSQHGVDAVFSGGLSLFDRQMVDGVQYIITGGAGGFIVDDENSYHHYTRVTVEGDQVRIEPIEVAIANTPLLSTLDSIWSAIYTFFYVSYARFLISVGVLVLIALKLREILFTERNYYRRFEIDPGVFLEQPKRIAFFSNNYFPFVSGVTLSIERLRSGLEHMGHEVALFVPSYGKNAAETEDTGVHRIRSVWSFGKNREFRLANLFSPAAIRALRAFRPRIIHVHHPFWLGSLGLFLGRRMNIPVVYTYHTRLEQYAHYVPLPSQIFRNFISHWLVKRFCNKCAGIVVPTVSVEEYLRALGVRPPILVQPTGIDFARFRHPDTDAQQKMREAWTIKGNTLTLITVSRLGREKNIDFILDGIHRLKDRTDRPFRLLIVGQGDEHDRLADRIATEGLSEQVVLTGPVPPDDMASAYQLADLFVFASKSETQGMVLLEAMSAGLPVVAVRSSGIDDVIRPGETGYKTRESVDEWSERIAQLLQDDDRRSAMSEAARRFARQHDIEHFSSNINTFYSEILAEHEQS